MASRNIGPFVYISAQSPQIGLLASILKARIPKSAYMYNMSVMYPRFDDKMKFFVYQGTVDENAWIFATFLRLDYGIEICISAPETATTFPPGIVKALEEPSTSFVDWAKPYEMISIDSKIAGSLIDMARRLTKTDPNTHGMQQVDIFECHHYISGDANAKLPASPELPAGAFMAPLNTETGAKVLYDEWPYSKEGTDVQCWDLVTRLHSAAVYVDDAPVSWSFLHQCGHLAIQTREAHRGRRFATRCLRKMVMELKNYGYYPCAMVDHDNVASNKVLKGAGMQPSHDVFFLIFGRS